jgi:hypothetical protein
MKRRDLILGSTGLLLPGIGRSAIPCPPSPVSIAGGTSVTTPCPAPVATYTTNFPLTENPMSEGGRWTDGGIFGKTNVQTSPGKAYGTMIGFDHVNFIDSCACLSGFGPNHEIMGTISNSGGFSGYSLEVELHLRSEIAADHIHLYEIDCVWGGPGIALVRWDMTTANPNNFTYLRLMSPGEVPFADGDQIYGSIVGSVITVKYKRAGGTLATLFTHDTAGDSVRYTTGNPGIGFWNESGNASIVSDFAFSSITANTL